MEKYELNIYSTRLLRDIVIGEVGYVLIDPQNNNTRGTTILTKDVFALRKDLYLFSNIEQVKRYLSITNSRLYILGIKKIGIGFFGRDFALDFSFLRWSGFIGFNLLNIKRDNLIRNKNYICFLNIKINYVEINIDLFLDKKETYYFGETYNTYDKKDLYYGDLLSNINFIENVKDLKKALKHAIESQQFEIAAKIRDKLKKNKKDEK